MNVKGIIACFLVVSFLLVSAIPINAAASQTTAAVLIDFGNGDASWADVPVSSGMNAFNLTIEATTALNLPIDYTVYSWGVSVNSIGSSVAEYPNEWWHFWLWNTTTNQWMMSSLGAASVNASSYTAFAWSFVQDRPDFSAPTPQSDPVHRYSWEQSRHDNLNTGFSNITTSISNDTIFSVNLNNGDIDPTMTVSGGRIYVVTQGIFNYTSFGYDKLPKVFCLNSAGVIVWSTNITGGGWQLASPLVAGPQLIVPSTDGTVYSLNLANGSVQWTYSVPFSYTGVTASPILYRDQIIIASGDGNVTALALNGTKVWNTKIASSIYFSAPAAKDGIIYVGSEDKKLHAVHADGSGEAWNVTVPGKVRSSPLLLDDKIVITYAVYSGMVAVDGGIAAYNYTGAQKWDVNINSTSASAAWTPKGLVVTSVNGVTMVSEEGAVLWTKNLGKVNSSPSVSRSGIYVLTYGSPGVAYMLGLNGTVIFNKTLLPAAFAMSSPVIADGKVYLASDNGYIYCLENVAPTMTAVFTTTNMKVSIDATVTDMEACTVTWDFGDGNTSTGVLVNHTYERAGNYTITAWAVDAQGGNSSMTQVVSATAAPAPASNDDTTIYIIIAVVAVVIVGAIVVVFARGRKKIRWREMKKMTMVGIIVVVLVAVVLVSGMGLFTSPTNGAKSKMATMTIDFSDATTDHFQGNITTWSNTSGVWTYETHASGNGTTKFIFKNISFASNVLDLMVECSKTGGFSITRQGYVGLGTIIQSIDGVANENPGRGWQYYVNGTYALVACDKTNLNGGEVIDWKFITLQGT